MPRDKGEIAWRKRQRQQLVGFKHKGVLPMIDRKPDPDELRQRYAEIPVDTRDITAYVFGDPVPGRRAIDRRQAA